MVLMWPARASHAQLAPSALPSGGNDSNTTTPAATAPRAASPRPVADADATGTAGHYLVLDRAQFLQTEDATPPPRTAAWQDVTLPDSWGAQKRNRSKRGWYRLTFEHRGINHDGHQAAQRAVYITRVTNNIELFLNGSPFAISGRLGPQAEESWNVTQFHFIPSSLIREGENELHIRLHPDGYSRAGIAAVHLGASDALKALYDNRYFVQTTAPLLITTVLALMCVFSLAIWLKRPSEKILLLFGLMAFAAVLRLFHHYLRDAPLILQLMPVPAMCWLTALQVSFVLRYADRPMPRLERVLYIFATMATVTLLGSTLYGTGMYWKVTTIVYACLAIATPFLFGTLVYQLTRKASGGNLLMIVAVFLTSAFGIHDFLNYREVLGYDRLYLIPLGLPLLLVAVAALLAQRFVGTLASYEQLNTELATRIDSREFELTASYARERELDLQRSTAEERQRLMRDMHDGLGSHLMSTLALMKRGQLSQKELESVLADAIDELKLTIDSLEPVERDLLVVLGNLRYRLEPRLRSAGIDLEWAVSDLPPLDYLDPENVRSVLRIIQEAFTNTLKHANAKRITLSTGVDRVANRVWVRVTDDGQSIDFEKVRRGRGLANMQSRAAKLKGEVEVVPLRGGGTCVNLFLPLTPAAQRWTPPSLQH
jgi:signal transduction histidine kinase